MFFSVSSKQTEEGSRLTVDVRVQSSSQSINAVSGTLSFTPNLVNVTYISKDKSIINLWTREPKVIRNQISFEGVALNPGFQGDNGLVFQITFEAKQAGTVFLNFNEGAILANDGLGTNILTKLSSANFNIIPSSHLTDKPLVSGDTGLTVIPIITKYFTSIGTKEALYIRGKGQPEALTKITFRDLSIKSIGERFVELLQSKKEKLETIVVKNNTNGIFSYVSSKDLVAGVYEATPSLIEPGKSKEISGIPVQFLVNDSEIIKNMVVTLNILGLLIPIISFSIIIFFIPWYSFRRMRVIKKKLALEEEKLDLSEHEIENQDKMLDKNN
jgi:hypothetical protein